MVDDYRVRADDEALLCRSANYVLVIDDLADRPHRCNALLDAMPYRSAADYVDLVPAGTTLWIGRDYALVRRSIVARREASLAWRERIPKSEDFDCTWHDRSEESNRRFTKCHGARRRRCSG